MSLLSEHSVPTHNKYIFVSPKKMCLFWKNVLIFGNELILCVLIMCGDSTSFSGHNLIKNNKQVLPK